MVNCPRCEAEVSVRRLLTEDLRHVACAECPAILSVRSRMALLPALVLIFLGPPLAKAVQDGWLSVALGVTVGVALLLLAGRIGYALSSTTVIRHRHRASRTPMRPSDSDVE